MTRFTKEHHHLRLESFKSFLQQHHLSNRSPELGRNDTFYVYREHELIRLIIGRSGTIAPTGRPGFLKDLLITWLVQEHLRNIDASSPGDMEKLDAYRYLLSPAPSPVRLPDLPSNALHKLTDCSQLVELAQRLGYHVYLTRNALRQDVKSPLYCITDGEKIVCCDDDLTQGLVHLIQHIVQLRHDPSSGAFQQSNNSSRD